MEEERPHWSDVLQALEALKRASKEVESNPNLAVGETGGDSGVRHSPSMKALLELEIGSDDLLSGDPYLSALSHLLSRLKALAFSPISDNGDSPREDGGGGRGFLRSILRRRSSSNQEISRVAGSIGTEIQSWIDRESVDRLVTALRSPPADGDGDEEREALLVALENRLAQGFNRGLQDALLQAGAFASVESALADPAAPKRVRERAASAVLALVRFNKAVFVGPVLMGTTIGALVAMASSAAAALRALNGLIAAIRSPLIDELHSRGDIPRLVVLLGSGDLEVQVLALEWALEMGYYSRKEAIDAMLAEGVIKRLVSLQRSELGGALIEMEGKEWDCDDDGGIQAGMLGLRPSSSRERRFLEARPFASCVARWAVQVEIGEGLRQREKRELKLEIIASVRDAVVTDAEGATVLAEVLWGSTRW